VIYVDSSVLLADLLAEPGSPPETLWDRDLASSRLLVYEVWNRIHANGLATSHGERAWALLTRITLTEMGAVALARALEPWPVSLRTLDALHLATMEFLRRNDGSIELASYDTRLVGAAQALGFPLVPL
jgi:predicted nucleic acid-binding protein